MEVKLRKHKSGDCYIEVDGKTLAHIHEDRKLYEIHVHVEKYPRFQIAEAVKKKEVHVILGHKKLSKVKRLYER